jgi:hypothetical protein
MQIVMGEEIAKELKEKYTVLELDTIPVDNRMVPAFCVLEPESIVFEMSTLHNNVELHEKLIVAIKSNDAQAASVIADSLQGRFGGVLDTFYQVILERVESTGSTQLVLPSKI